MRVRDVGRLAVLLAAGTVAGAAVVIAPVAPAPPALADIGECPPDGQYPGIGTGVPEWTDNSIAVFAAEDFTATAQAAEVEGLVVVFGDALVDKTNGGRFNVGSVGVGSGIAPSPGTTMLAVGGDLAIGPTTILDVGANLPGGGNVRVGGTLTVDDPIAQLELNGGEIGAEIGADAVAEWAGFETVLATASADLAVLPPNGATSVAPTELTFTGDGSTDLQVFAVDSTVLAGASTIRFVGIGITTPVVINVTGAQATLAPTFISNDGERVDDFASPNFGNVAARTLWNFVDATQVSLAGSSQILGSVIAPTPGAAVTITASTNGRVHSGGSITVAGAGNELHNYPWIGGPPFACEIEPPGPLVPGQVTVTKLLADGTEVPPGRTFTGFIICTAPTGAEVLAAWIAAPGETVVVDGLPVGGECTATERLDFQRPTVVAAALPIGRVFDDPVWLVNGEPADPPEFVVPAPDEPGAEIALTVVNAFVPPVDPVDPPVDPGTPTGPNGGGLAVSGADAVPAATMGAALLALGVVVAAVAWRRRATRRTPGR